MSAGQIFFEQAAQFHFQRIGVGRHAEVKVEKAVIHRFQGESEAKPAISLSFRLREPGHGADGRHFVSG